VGLDRLIVENERDGQSTKIVVCNEKVGNGFVVIPKASACVRSGEQTVNVIRAAWHRFCESERDEALEDFAATGQLDFDDLRFDIDDLLASDDFQRRPIDEHLADAISYVERVKRGPAVGVTE
jgi:hypothetical protein